MVAHNALGVVPLPSDAADLALKLLPVASQGAEPTIGVTKDGSIYVTGGSGRVLRSSDHGKSWQDVSDRTRQVRDFDPYLWVDPTTDRIYSVPLYIACSNLFWSDNGAKSWEWNPAGGCGLPGHDHQSLSTGPPPKGVSTQGYPNVVYYTYNSFRSDGTWVTTSLDGGQTWNLGTKVADGDDCQSALDGAPAVGPDGTVYVPMPRCKGLRIGTSKDAGKTWSVRDVNDVGMLGVTPATPLDDTPFSPNPGADVDEAGHAYVAFPGADGRMYVTRSADGGNHWSKPLRVSPPEVNSTAFSTLVAGADGRIAMAYFGTNASTDGWKGKSAQFAPPSTVWHLYFTIASDAMADDPVFTTVRATPPEDPVQIGCIWQSGGVNDCRNLADFFDLTERDGRPYLVYSDGCRKCTSNAQSRQRDLFVGVVDTGPSLGGLPLAPYV